MIAYLTLLILFFVLVVLWVVVLFNVGTRYTYPTTTWVALVFGTLSWIVAVVSVAYATNLGAIL